MNINNLPNEILFNIFEYLPVCDKLSFSSTNKNIRNLCNNYESLDIIKYIKSILENEEKTITKNMPLKYYYYLLKENPFLIKKCNKELLDYKLCKYVIKRAALFINNTYPHIGDLYKANKIFDLIVTYIPKVYLINNLYIYLIELFPMILSMIPDSDFTYKLSYEIIDVSPINFMFIPMHIVDYTMCQYAVLKYSLNISLIPNKYLTYELCDLAISIDSDHIVDIPFNMIDYKMALKVVMDNYKLISKIPIKYRTLEILKIVIRKDFSLIKYFHIDKHII